IAQDNCAIPDATQHRSGHCAHCARTTSIPDATQHRSGTTVPFPMPLSVSIAQDNCAIPDATPASLRTTVPFPDATQHRSGQLCHSRCHSASLRTLWPFPDANDAALPVGMPARRSASSASRRSRSASGCSSSRWRACRCSSRLRFQSGTPDSLVASASRAASAAACASSASRFGAPASPRGASPARCRDGGVAWHRGRVGNIVQGRRLFDDFLRRWRRRRGGGGCGEVSAATGRRSSAGGGGGSWLASNSSAVDSCCCCFCEDLRRLTPCCSWAMRAADCCFGCCWEAGPDSQLELERATDAALPVGHAGQALGLLRLPSEPLGLRLQLLALAGLPLLQQAALPVRHAGQLGGLGKSGSLCGRVRLQRLPVPALQHRPAPVRRAVGDGRPGTADGSATSSKAAACSTTSFGGGGDGGAGGGCGEVSAATGRRSSAGGGGGSWLASNSSAVDSCCCCFCEDLRRLTPCCSWAMRAADCCFGCCWEAGPDSQLELERATRLAGRGNRGGVSWPRQRLNSPSLRWWHRWGRWRSSGRVLLLLHLQSRWRSKSRYSSSSSGRAWQMAGIHCLVAAPLKFVGPAGAVAAPLKSVAPVAPAPLKFVGPVGVVPLKFVGPAGVAPLKPVGPAETVAAPLNSVGPAAEVAVLLQLVGPAGAIAASLKSVGPVAAALLKFVQSAAAVAALLKRRLWRHLRRGAIEAAENLRHGRHVSLDFSLGSGSRRLRLRLRVLRQVPGLRFGTLGLFGCCGGCCCCWLRCGSASQRRPKLLQEGGTAGCCGIGGRLALVGVVLRAADSGASAELAPPECQTRVVADSSQPGADSRASGLGPAAHDPRLGPGEAPHRSSPKLASPPPEERLGAYAGALRVPLLLSRCLIVGAERIELLAGLAEQLVEGV
uniref:SMB domain-containing protein n=1 Tax=Macrostomum lignano TaxID=282301 RepID=A0A1I8GEH9_9PLAT